MKPRQGRIVEVGRKDFAEQHIIPNVQCHQLAIVQQMIKRVTCTIVHSELGLQEPSRRFVANDMRVEWRGEYIIQLSADRAQMCLFCGLGNNWQLRLRRLEAWWALMAFDRQKPHRYPLFCFPLLELIASLGWDWVGRLRKGEMALQVMPIRHLMTLNVVAQSKQTYSKARDAAQVYEVKVKTIAAKQGSKTVIEYANQLKALWQELDHYRVIKTKCPEDAAVLKDFIEQDRVYDFLVGLNPEFDQVRIQILGRDRDRERAASRNPSKGSKGKDDGLTPEQRRERDAKALQEKAAKKAGQAASGGSGDAGGKSTKK
ncbi:hypothetical protein CK203_029304 [Vitis vinifera]|uniref:Small EDRK-rich factor-like N-terminal domain-containing protein n=1 Tax=Vitis vinifera TaxID=29760 RepID=A0A438IST2_VITVI|nr:hypothetical protein CK203_029304 [Vitis vinifera]